MARRFAARLSSFGDFWGERDVRHLHHLMFVHEFGATRRAIVAMIAFRESFQTPLKKVVMGLRSMVCSEMGLERVGQNVPVAQRLVLPI
jgi:hypothetical protein